MTGHSQLRQSSDQVPTFQRETRSKQLQRLKEQFRSEHTAIAHSSSCPNFHNQQINKQKQEKKKLKANFPELFIKGSNYEAKKIIGSGAYSIVCEAIDTRTNTVVAIKKITNVFANSKEAIRTLREIKLMHHFNHHQNILSIREVLLPKHASKFNHLLIVLEKMEYDLSELIQRSGKLARAERCRITHKIVLGLRQIHLSNVIHRDLRPKNVLLNGSNQEVVICDFGMGRSIGLNLSLLSFTTATLYTPPEGLLAVSQYDKGVDVWAVGCILAEMILGDRLVHGQTHDDIIKFVMQLVGIPSLSQIDSLITDPLKNQFTKSLRSEILSSNPFYSFHYDDNDNDNNNNVNNNNDNNNNNNGGNIENDDYSLQLFASLFATSDQDDDHKVDEIELDLLRKIFTFDPKDRISAADLLHHPYFSDLPIDQPIDFQLPKFEYDDSDLLSLSTPQLQKVVYNQLLQLFPNSVYPI